MVFWSKNGEHDPLNPSESWFSARGCSVQGKVAVREEYSACGASQEQRRKPVKENNPSNGKQGNVEGPEKKGQVSNRRVGQQCQGLPIGHEEVLSQ